MKLKEALNNFYKNKRENEGVLVLAEEKNGAMYFSKAQIAQLENVDVIKTETDEGTGIAMSLSGRTGQGERYRTLYIYIDSKQARKALGWKAI